MVSFESAEFFEQEMNPNLYAGARMIAEQLLGIDAVYCAGQPDGDILDKNIPNEPHKKILS